MVESLGLAPGEEMFNSTVLPAGCGATSAEVVLGTYVYAMNANAGTVTRYSVHGEGQVVYGTQNREYVTDQTTSDIRRNLSESSFTSTAPNDTVDAVLERTLSIGTALPAWTGMIGDPSGRIWLRTAECPAPSTGNREYEIVDLEGRQHGSISIPASWRLLAVNGSRILVVRRDELDVEHLELYQMHPLG
jgi:hypothetical protein